MNVSDPEQLDEDGEHNSVSDGDSLTSRQDTQFVDTTSVSLRDLDLMSTNSVSSIDSSIAKFKEELPFPVFKTPAVCKHSLHFSLDSSFETSNSNEDRDEPNTKKNNESLIGIIKPAVRHHSVKISNSFYSSFINDSNTEQVSQSLLELGANEKSPHENSHIGDTKEASLGTFKRPKVIRRSIMLKSFLEASDDSILNEDSKGEEAAGDTVKINSKNDIQITPESYSDVAEKSGVVERECCSVSDENVVSSTIKANEKSENFSLAENSGSNLTDEPNNASTDCKNHESGNEKDIHLGYSNQKQESLLRPSFCQKGEDNETEHVSSPLLTNVERTPSDSLVQNENCNDIEETTKSNFPLHQVENKLERNTPSKAVDFRDSSEPVLTQTITSVLDPRQPVGGADLNKISVLECSKNDDHDELVIVNNSELSKTVGNFGNELGTISPNQPNIRRHSIKIAESFFSTVNNLTQEDTSRLIQEVNKSSSNTLAQQKSCSEIGDALQYEDSLHPNRHDTETDTIAKVTNELNNPKLLHASNIKIPLSNRKQILSTTDLKTTPALEGGQNEPLFPRRSYDIVNSSVQGKDVEKLDNHLGAMICPDRPKVRRHSIKIANSFFSNLNNVTEEDSTPLLDDADGTSDLGARKSCSGFEKLLGGKNDNKSLIFTRPEHFALKTREENKDMGGVDKYESAIDPEKPEVRRHSIKITNSFFTTLNNVTKDNSSVLQNTDEASFYVASNKSFSEHEGALRYGTSTVPSKSQPALETHTKAADTSNQSNQPPSSKVETSLIDSGITVNTADLNATPGLKGKTNNGVSFISTKPECVITTNDEYKHMGDHDNQNGSLVGPNKPEVRRHSIKSNGSFYTNLNNKDNNITIQMSSPLPEGIETSDHSTLRGNSSDHESAAQFRFLLLPEEYKPELEVSRKSLNILNQSEPLRSPNNKLSLVRLGQVVDPVDFNRTPTLNSSRNDDLLSKSVRKSQGSIVNRTFSINCDDGYKSSERVISVVPQETDSYNKQTNVGDETFVINNGDSSVTERHLETHKNDETFLVSNSNLEKSCVELCEIDGRGETIIRETHSEEQNLEGNTETVEHQMKKTNQEVSFEKHTKQIVNTISAVGDEKEKHENNKSEATQLEERICKRDTVENICHITINSLKFTSEGQCNKQIVANSERASVMESNKNLDGSEKQSRKYDTICKASEVANASSREVVVQDESDFTSSSQNQNERDIGNLQDNNVELSLVLDVEETNNSQKNKETELIDKAAHQSLVEERLVSTVEPEKEMSKKNKSFTLPNVSEKIGNSSEENVANVMEMDANIDGSKEQLRKHDNIDNVSELASESSRKVVLLDEFTSTLQHQKKTCTENIQDKDFELTLVLDIEEMNNSKKDKDNIAHLSQMEGQLPSTVEPGKDMSMKNKSCNSSEVKCDAENEELNKNSILCEKNRRDEEIEIKNKEGIKPTEEALEQVTNCQTKEKNLDQSDKTCKVKHFAESLNEKSENRDVNLVGDELEQKRNSKESNKPCVIGEMDELLDTSQTTLKPNGTKDLIEVKDNIENSTQNNESVQQDEEIGLTNLKDNMRCESILTVQEIGNIEREVVNDPTLINVGEKIGNVSEDNVCVEKVNYSQKNRETKLTDNSGHGSQMEKQLPSSDKPEKEMFKDNESLTLLNVGEKIGNKKVEALSKKEANIINLKDSTLKKTDFSPCNSDVPELTIDVSIIPPDSSGARRKRPPGKYQSTPKRVKLSGKPSTNIGGRSLSVSSKSPRHSKTIQTRSRSSSSPKDSKSDEVIDKMHNTRGQLQDIINVMSTRTSDKGRRSVTFSQKLEYISPVVSKFINTSQGKNKNVSDVLVTEKVKISSESSELQPEAGTNTDFDNQFNMSSELSNIPSNQKNKNVTSSKKRARVYQSTPYVKHTRSNKDSPSERNNEDAVLIDKSIQMSKNFTSESNSNTGSDTSELIITRAKSKDRETNETCRTQEGRKRLKHKRNDSKGETSKPKQCKRTYSSPESFVSCKMSDGGDEFSNTITELSSKVSTRTRSHTATLGKTKSGILADVESTTFSSGVQVSSAANKKFNSDSDRTGIAGKVGLRSSTGESYVDSDISRGAVTSVLPESSEYLTDGYSDRCSDQNSNQNYTTRISNIVNSIANQSGDDQIRGSCRRGDPTEMSFQCGDSVSVVSEQQLSRFTLGEETSDVTHPFEWEDFEWRERGPEIYLQNSEGRVYSQPVFVKPAPPKGPAKSQSRQAPILHINGIPYKKPKKFKPARWVTDDLYKFLELKLKPIHGIETLIKSKEVVGFLHTHVTCVIKTNMYTEHSIDLVKKMLFDMKICSDEFGYKMFLLRYTPKEYFKKAVPSIAHLPCYVNI